MTLLFLFVAFALGVSFFCSLLEATLLSARLAHLNERVAHGSRGAGVLLELKRVRLDDAISAILTLNTVANTLGATLAGAQAAIVFGDVWVGVFSGVLTLMILVFSEIIPKTLGAVYAARLSGFVGWSLRYLVAVMRPVLFLSGAITRLLTRGRSTGISRGDLAAVIATATQEGTLTQEESKMLANLLRFNDVRVQDVMTPRSVMFMLPQQATIEEMLAEPEADVFSRIPLFNGERDDVVGYVLQRDVLRAVAQNCSRADPLQRFKRSISFIPELASVSQALRQILERREPIAMVADEHGGVEGLVTLEDLTETMLGVEIVDESDRDVDLRKSAMQRRDRRLEQMRELRRLQLEQANQERGDTS